MLFLRQLVLDGQWDDVFQFISPLEPIETFQTKEVHYLINKYKYIELLCIRAEVGPFQNAEVAVKEIVSCLNELEKYCPTKEDYNQFCLLLTLQNLDQHADYKNWNPSNSRVHCFNKLCPYLEPFLPVTRKPGQSAPKTAKNDRLVQLIIKGILYESCVEYCQRKATASTTSLPVDLDYSGLLDSVGFTNADLSLLSWLQSIPGDTFNFPFQDRTLNVQIEKLNKPSLMATWSEMILVSPIKPCVFPHSATPFTRVKAADLMSKSLSSANVDHLSKSVMSFSLKDAANLSQSSIAGAEFHLSGTVESSEKNVNEKQVERMFEEGNVFNSSLFGKLQTIRESTDALTHALNTDSVCGTSPAVCPSFSTHTPLLASNGKTESAQTNYWRQFQKKKDEHHQDLQQLDSLAMPSGHFNGNCVRFTPTIQESETNDRSKYCTPEGQLGQKNFTDMKKLMTSTPKGSKAMLSTTELMQINHQLDFSNASSIKENRTLISQCNSTAATPCNTTERNSSTDSIGLTCATSTLSTSTTQQPSLTSISSMSSVKSNQTMKSTNGRPPPVTQWQQALINQTPVTATFASSSVSIIQSHHHHHPQQNQAPPALGITSVAASPPSFPATMPAPWLISSVSFFAVARNVAIVLHRFSAHLSVTRLWLVCCLSCSLLSPKHLLRFFCVSFFLSLI